MIDQQREENGQPISLSANPDDTATPTLQCATTTQSSRQIDNSQDGDTMGAGAQQASADRSALTASSPPASTSKEKANGKSPKRSPKSKASTAKPSAAKPQIPEAMRIPVIGPAPLLPANSPNSFTPQQRVHISGATEEEIAAIAKLRKLLQVEQNAIRACSSQDRRGSQDGSSGTSPSHAPCTKGKDEATHDSSKRGQAANKGAEDDSRQEQGKTQLHGKVHQANGPRHNVGDAHGHVVGENSGQGADCTLGASSLSPDKDMQMSNQKSNSSQECVPLGADKKEEGEAHEDTAHATSEEKRGTPPTAAASKAMNPPSDEGQDPQPKPGKAKGKTKGKLSALKSQAAASMKSLIKGKPSSHTAKMKPHLPKPLTDYEWWWCDEKCLLRFLRARDLNIKKAFLMIIETIKFRRKYQPHILCPQELQELNREGHLYRHGFDSDGRPIIMMWPTEESIKAKDDQQIKNIMYHLERAIASIGVDCETKQDTIVFLVNYASFSAVNQPPLSVTKSFLEIFSLHYPERLYKAYIIDAPWYFNTFYNVVASFIPTRTKEKIDFIDSTNPEHVKRIHSQIPKDIIPADVGGSGMYRYDFDAYWDNERTQYFGWFEYMKQKFNPHRPGQAINIPLVTGDKTKPTATEDPTDTVVEPDLVELVANLDVSDSDNDSEEEQNESQPKEIN